MSGGCGVDAYWPNFSKKAEDSPEKAMGDSDEHEGGEPGAEVECFEDATPEPEDSKKKLAAEVKMKRPSAKTRPKKDDAEKKDKSTAAAKALAKKKAQDARAKAKAAAKKKAADAKKMAAAKAKAKKLAAAKKKADKEKEMEQAKKSKTCMEVGEDGEEEKPEEDDEVDSVDAPTLALGSPSPSQPRLGCSKCRFAVKGCSRCKVKAGLRWFAS